MDLDSKAVVAYAIKFSLEDFKPSELAGACIF